MTELREGDLSVNLTVRKDGSKLLLDLELRRRGRLGLKIHEKLPSLERMKEILERPVWLGGESNDLIRRALKLISEGEDEATRGC